MTHKHDKVYAPFILTSYPEQYPWICRTCGTEGTDIAKILQSKGEYYNIRKKFGK